MTGVSSIACDVRWLVGMGFTYPVVVADVAGHEPVSTPKLRLHGLRAGLWFLHGVLQ